MLALPDIAANAEHEWSLWPTLSRAEQDTRRRLYSKDGIRWSKPAKLWCGAFAAFCAPGLHPVLALRLWSSTYRMRVFAHYTHERNLWRTTYVRLPGGEQLRVRDWHEDQGSVRLAQHPAASGGVLRWLPGRGDIATVRKVQNRDYGGHIVVIVGVDEDGVDTISGNAGGIISGGALIRRGGVARRSYRVEDLQMVFRPSTCDLVQDVSYVEPT